FRDIARLQPVDDLDRAGVAGAQHQLYHAALHDQVVQVALDQLLAADPGDELCLRVLLRIGGVEAVFILNEDHRAAAKDLRHQVNAGIGAVLRHAAHPGRRLPPVVGGHAGDDDRGTGGEVHGQLVELLFGDADPVVLAHQGG